MNEKTLTAIYIILFLIGLIFVRHSGGFRENFSSGELFSNNCPDKIVQKKDGIYLYNTKKAEVPGVNPIKFDNLEEYVEYMQWLKSQNITCPILFYKETYSTQNEKVLRHDNGMSFYPDLGRGGDITSQLIDAGRDPNSPFNRNMHPGFDQQNQYIGVRTPLDKIFNEPGVISDNPMDPNWGGKRYTEKKIKEGKYKEDEVSIYIP